FADLDTLRTLPPNDVAAGLAEVVKCGFIRDPQILDIIEDDPAAALDVTSEPFADIVARAIRVKADVVSSDLREVGEREIL
ncbi:3-dehydroquinate synthase, partial [Prevotella bivia]|nr:3-dehydroquinate synthase [Prevotella bivia]